ncbi:F-box only protein 5 [Denticeps clupeoides]|uniref:F-box only protein 5 n=1 Tax=Denticeps clupeoides TaxID=299321 RepID=UPI0010A537AB|nr:F-box only protein 5 [Denticeps clupeoides]
MEMRCTRSVQALVLRGTEKRMTNIMEGSGQTESPKKKCVKALPSPSVPSVVLQKGKENKANAQPAPPEQTSDDEGIICSGGFTEDSGYLSLHNSQIDHSDVDLIGHLDSSVERQDTNRNPVENCHLGSTLPLVQFQQDVCRRLSDGFRKTQRYNMSVISKMSGSFALHHVIGRKMGLEGVDVLRCLLEKDLRHILARILSLVHDHDLISCKKVCKTWRDIICQDKSVLKRCLDAEQKLKMKKPTGTLSRDFASSRVAFSRTQHVSSTPVSSPGKKTQKDGASLSSRGSQFHRYLEVGKNLKQHESLKSCRRCSGPARVDHVAQRAVCTSISCGFDFCTACLGVFHGSAACRTGVVTGWSSKSKAKPLLPGSTRSKRNVRRL